MPEPKPKQSAAEVKSVIEEPLYGPMPERRKKLHVVRPEEVQEIQERGRRTERIESAKNGFQQLVTLLRLLNPDDPRTKQVQEILETMMEGHQVKRTGTSNPGQNLSYVETVVGQKSVIRMVVKPERGAKRFRVRYEDGQMHNENITALEDQETGEITEQASETESGAWFRVNATTVEAMKRRVADLCLIPVEEVPISSTEFLHKPGFAKEQFVRNEVTRFLMSEFYRLGRVPPTAPRDHRFMQKQGGKETERKNLDLCSAQMFIRVKGKEAPRPLRADELMHLERFGPQAPDMPMVVLNERGKPVPIKDANGDFIPDEATGEIVMVRGKERRVKVERRTLDAKERAFFTTLCQSHKRAEDLVFLTGDADNNEGNFLVDPETGEGFLTDGSYSGGFSEPYDSPQVDRFGKTVLDANGRPTMIRGSHPVGVTVSFLADTSMPHPDWLTDQEAYKRYSEVLDQTEEYLTVVFPRIRKIRERIAAQRDLLGVKSFHPEKETKEIETLKTELGGKSMEFKFLYETFLYQYEHPAIAEFQLEQHLRKLKYLVYRGSPPRIPKGEAVTVMPVFGLNVRHDQWAAEKLTPKDLAETMAAVGV